VKKGVVRYWHYVVRSWFRHSVTKQKAVPSTAVVVKSPEWAEDAREWLFKGSVVNMSM